MLVVGVAVLFVTVAASALGYWKGLFRRGLASHGLENLAISSLTSTGDVVLARISPDGHYLAYVSRKNGENSLWVRQIAAPSAVQILPPSRNIVVDVSFTAGGNFLDYTQLRPPGLEGKVYRLPFLGGVPRQLLGAANTEAAFPMSNLAFSPDSRKIAYGAFDLRTNSARLMVADADGSGARKISERKSSVELGDYSVVHWSPDGRHLTTYETRTGDTKGLTSVLVDIDAHSGAERPLPGGAWRAISDFNWLPDGSGVLLAAKDKTGVPTQLWTVAYPGGQVRRVTNDLGDYLSASISMNANTVASVQTNAVTNIWVADSKMPDALKQVSSGKFDGVYGLGWTPDERIVYTANPAQNIGLFIMDADGGNARQLSFEQGPNDAPAVCQQGRTVVYDTNFEGRWHVWKLDVQSGVNTKLTNGFGEIDARCPRAGDVLMYKGQVSDGTAYIWKMPLSGGEPVKLTERIALAGPIPSADGRHLAFPSIDEKGKAALIVVSAESGLQEAELEVPPTIDGNSHSISWMPDNRSIVISDLRSGVPNLWALPALAKGKPRQLTHFTSGAIWSFQWSPSGKNLAIARGSNNSDVVLLNATK